MTELFIDCTRGLAGDMLSAALLELFPDPDIILNLLNEIGIPGIRFAAERNTCYGIAGTHMSVQYHGVEEDEEMLVSSPEKRRCHSDDILKIIDCIDVPESVREDVRVTYQYITDAEAIVHGTPPGYVHFHELGSMDALADISAVCMMLHLLKPVRITVSPICTGYGSFRCRRGVLPVPAPATAMILRGMPSFAGEIEGEMCTPTGTALVKHLADDYGYQPMMTVQKIGYGFGKKDYGQLSCVRVCMGKQGNML